MALDVARDTYHQHRQDQRAREAVKEFSRDTLSTQSQSLGRRYKHANNMEAQDFQSPVPSYGSANTYQIDSYGPSQISPPPRTSSNQRISGAGASSTPTNDRVRGPRAYHSPSTPQPKSMRTSDHETDPKLEANVSGTSFSQNPLQSSPAYQAPTTPQRKMSNTANRSESARMQAALAEQTSERLDRSVLPTQRQESHVRASPTQASSPVAYPSQGARHSSDNPSQHLQSSSRQAPFSSQGQPTYSRAQQDIRSQPNSAAAQRSRPSGAQPAPAGVSQESGEILNRVVISDPEGDIKREEERIEEANPTGQHEETPKSTTKRRQEFAANSAKRKEVKFGEYILGQTLGEGEFGKVKLGWKKDGSVEVAIKLIRRENLNANPTRLPKIYREVNILRGLEHPNIVQLHEMLETDRYIGIVMECASGGELFDYILHHRYLKDAPAKRLFAQLVSGVGYLHKKGIVHRDLKLENLLLDRHRNIIITDFGFANTFDPRDELSEETEEHITDKAWVKKHSYDKISKDTGFRRGDLMATSCGSPCYAAPELVVTDSLYTGRKVDVWSCGVILYAMLAGYLPFDDDPANPEGDNINLLYKYIVSTPLTFPEYVSPHSRDLLRQMLVPDPRKRADLFEVARHSWLNDYASAIAQFTSMGADSRALPIVSITPGKLLLHPLCLSPCLTPWPERAAAPSLARSASVREPSKPYTASPTAPIGGLNHQGKFDQQAEGQRTPRDPKRRTVQVEYVAPQSQTARGQDPVPMEAHHSTSESPITASPNVPRQASARKPLPQNPPVGSRSRQTGDFSESLDYQPQYSADMAPPPRSTRDVPRSVSDSASAFGQYPNTTPRPNTRGSISSTNGRLPSRGQSYGQPVAPTVAATNAQGRLAQPRGPRYNISNPIPQPQPEIPNEPGDRPTSQRLPGRQAPVLINTSQVKSHKRSSTLTNIFTRPASIFGSSKSQAQTPTDSEKSQRKYPPTSMRGPIVSGTTTRVSSESHRTEPRRTSFGFSRQSSDISRENRPRRFSLLPASFSLKNFTGSAKDASSASSHAELTHQQYAQAPEASSYEEQQMPRNTSENFLAQPRTRILQKPQRNFSEAFNQDEGTKHAGSSGPARRVMDFFRRRGKARAGED